MNIVDKIKKLLNQTVENGCTEEEAKTAFIIARKLMIKHKLEEKDIKDSKEDFIIKEELEYNCNVVWMYNLIKVFVDNFGVMNFMINKYKEMHLVLFGNKVDVECVKTLVHCAFEYLESTSQSYMNEYVDLFGIKDETIIDSFRIGFINGLIDKYKEQNKLLTNEEALMVIPSENVRTEFNEFTKNFDKQSFDSNMDLNDKDFLAMRAGYNKGKLFGTTALNQ